MGEIGEALAKPLIKEFAGRTWTIQPLDLNDIADLEDAIGSVDLLDITSARHQRVCMWLIFRKADPQLGHDDRANCRYHMTLQDAGRLLTAEELVKPTTLPFLIEILQYSGLMPKQAEEGAEGGDSKKASTTIRRSREKSGASSTSSVSVADTPAQSADAPL